MWKRTLALFLVICLVGSLVYVLWTRADNVGRNIDKVVNEYNQVSRSKAALSNALGIKGLSDIYFYQNTKKLSIHFGKNELAFDKDMIANKETILNLKKLDITMKVMNPEDRTVKLFYKGEEIKEVVK